MGNNQSVWEEGHHSTKLPSTKTKTTRNRKNSVSKKKECVLRLESHEINMLNACQEYNVQRQTILEWIQLYGCKVVPLYKELKMDPGTRMHLTKDEEEHLELFLKLCPPIHRKYTPIEIYNWFFLDDLSPMVNTPNNAKKWRIFYNQLIHRKLAPMTRQSIQKLFHNYDEQFQSQSFALQSSTRKQNNGKQNNGKQLQQQPQPQLYLARQSKIDKLRDGKNDPYGAFCLPDYNRYHHQEGCGSSWKWVGKDIGSGRDAYLDEVKNILYNHGGKGQSYKKRCFIAGLVFKGNIGGRNDFHIITPEFGSAVKIVIQIVEVDDDGNEIDVVFQSEAELTRMHLSQAENKMLKENAEQLFDSGCRQDDCLGKNGTPYGQMGCGGISSFGKAYVSTSGSSKRKRKRKSKNQQAIVLDHFERRLLEIQFNHRVNELRNPVDQVEPPLKEWKLNQDHVPMCSMMASSENLGNECHTDLDGSRSMAIWHHEEYKLGEDDDSLIQNGFFLFPDAKCNIDGEVKGIAIRLLHGTVISWDGRYVRHCTAVPNWCGGEVRRLLSTFFGNRKFIPNKPNTKKSN